MPNVQNYFDYGAATPMLPEVITAMQPYFSDSFYNPSALYLAARDNRIVLDEARHSLAKSLGARPTEIIFTAGGTEANNLAIKGIVEQFKDGHIITTAIEHDSVIKPVKKSPNHTIIAPDARGVVSVADISKAVTDTTVLISVMYANNEIGAIQPIQAIAELVKTVRASRKVAGNNYPLYLHIDACQAGNYLDMHVSRLGVDLMSINAGKVYGPKQTGGLYVKAGVRLQALIDGGGQEWGVRSGTENLANIVGFVTAWQIARNLAQTEVKRITELRDNFIKELQTAVPSVIINGPSGNRRLANNIHITLPGFDNERLLMQLDEAGFQVATGSACSASNDEPSHVLKAIGLSDADAQSSLRITLGKYTSTESLESLRQTLTKIVALS